MYAQRYQSGAGGKTVGLGAAVAINAGLLALLMSTGVVPGIREPDIGMTITNIPIDVPPPPEPIEQPPIDRIETAAPPLPYRPDPIIDLPTPQPDIRVTTEFPPLPPPPFTGTGVGAGTGTGTAIIETPAPPALIGAEIDSRFARDFQPDYPAIDRRAEREGRVQVRVLIGADGRVKAVERVSAASDAMFEATRRQALSRWRFCPATRGDQKVESWKTMTVRFEMSAA